MYLNFPTGYKLEPKEALEILARDPTLTLLERPKIWGSLDDK